MAMDIAPPEGGGQLLDKQFPQTWKPLMKAEYTMWQLDYERFNYWIKWCEFWSATIESKNYATLDELQNYFASLNVLYKPWRTLIAIPITIRMYDDAIAEAKKLKRQLEREKGQGLPQNMPLTLKLTDILDKIHTQLMELKQLINLGIPVRRVKSAEDRIKEGMRIKNKKGAESGSPELDLADGWDE